MGRWVHQTCSNGKQTIFAAANKGVKKGKKILPGFPSKLKSAVDEVPSKIKKKSDYYGHRYDFYPDLKSNKESKEKMITLSFFLSWDHCTAADFEYNWYQDILPEIGIGPNPDKIMVTAGCNVLGMDIKTDKQVTTFTATFWAIVHFSQYGVSNHHLEWAWLVTGTNCKPYKPKAR